ncbi:LysR family transcriptional regulator [Tsukamurella pulmonis]|uniref:LysR family transcriptional regulator n=1 Tax=Tsukamurella pulmonis TaxID=47312 RepID=UPI000E09219F|nr:LysR family transcriptional regulator [Tsukamurella pulmonis]RDH11569.1 LysR family transcriptional regulator [Tsukamurella pulmonis]BDD84513.1 LysR family transcriptional regulator [Tsukamurella pulmonis]
MDDLRRLRYYVALVRHGHFGNAAAELHITQPALSQQIKKLERDLGVELVDRHARGFVLTAAGEHLARNVAELLRAADDLAEAVRDHAAGTRGEVRIAYTRSGADAGIAKRIRHFRLDHPHVRITSITGWTAWNLDMLRAEEIDLAFARGDLHDPGLEFLRCGAEELAAVVPADHSLAAEPRVTAEQIRGEPLVFWTRETGPEYYDEVIEAVFGGAVPRIVAEEPDAEQVLDQVAHGVGVSVLDRRRSTRIRPPGAVVIPLVDAPSVAISLAWRRGDESPAVRELVAWWRLNG